MVSMTANIKGNEWKFNLLSDKQYFKKHEDNSYGITDVDTYTVDFNKPKFTFGTVVHELTHCYVFASLVESMDIDKHDMEELICEINASHITEMLSIAIKIFDTFSQSMRPKGKKKK